MIGSMSCLPQIKRLSCCSCFFNLFPICCCLLFLFLFVYICFSSEQRAALRVLSQVGGELCGGSDQSLITKPHRRGMGIWEQGLFHIGRDP